MDIYSDGPANVLFTVHFHGARSPRRLLHQGGDDPKEKYILAAWGARGSAPTLDPRLEPVNSTGGNLPARCAARTRTPRGSC